MSSLVILNLFNSTLIRRSTKSLQSTSVVFSHLFHVCCKLGCHSNALWIRFYSTVVHLICAHFHHCSVEPVNCIIIGKMKSLQTTVRKHSQRAVIHLCDIVWTIPHSHLLADAKPHFCRFVIQGFSPVQKRFSAHHMQRERLPNYRVVTTYKSQNSLNIMTSLFLQTA